LLALAPPCGRAGERAGRHGVKLNELEKDVKQLPQEAAMTANIHEAKKET